MAVLTQTPPPTLSPQATVEVDSLYEGIDLYSSISRAKVRRLNVNRTHQEAAERNHQEFMRFLDHARPSDQLLRAALLLKCLFINI